MMKVHLQEIPQDKHVVGLFFHLIKRNFVKSAMNYKTALMSDDCNNVWNSE